MLITMLSRDISDIPNWMYIQLLAPFIRYDPPLPHPRDFTHVIHYGHESAAEPAQLPKLRLHLHYPVPRHACRKTLAPPGRVSVELPTGYPPTDGAFAFCLP